MADYLNMTEDELYREAINVFRDVKLLDGPLGLSSSLRRHSRLVEWLKSHQKSVINSIESELYLFNEL